MNFNQYSTAAAQPGIGVDQITNLTIPLPPLAEQEAIAAFLDRECARIDELVAAQQRMVALLREKRQAVIAHAVTRGLDPAVALRDSGVAWLGQVPAHWEVVPVLSKFQLREESNSNMKEQNLLSLSYGKIVKKDIESNDGLLPESFETYQIVYSGDIVFRFTDLQNDKKSLRSAIVTEKGIITSAYLAIAPKYGLPQFFDYLFRAYDVLKVYYSMGGGLRQSLKYDDFKRTPIPLPPLAEQEAIAAFLDAECARIDALISSAERAVVLLQERRSAVIAAAVTGQIRVG